MRPRSPSETKPDTDAPSSPTSPRRNWLNPFAKPVPAADTAPDEPKAPTEYQQLIARHKKLEADKLTAELSLESLKKRSQDSLIKLMGKLRILKPALESLKSDAERFITTQLRWDLTIVDEKFKKDYKDSRSAKHAFPNDEQAYNDFRNMYNNVRIQLSAVTLGTDHVMDQVVAKQKNTPPSGHAAVSHHRPHHHISKPHHGETPADTNDAEDAADAAPTMAWLTENLAQFAAKQYHAEPKLICGHAEESALIKLLESSENLADKQDSVEKFLIAHENKPNLLHDILIQLENAAVALQKNHWLKSTETAKSVQKTYYEQGCAKLFNTVFVSAATRNTIDFINDESHSASMDEKRIVADYHLKAAKDENRSDRLTKIMDDMIEKHSHEHKKHAHTRVRHA